MPNENETDFLFGGINQSIFSNLKIFRAKNEGGIKHLSLLKNEKCFFQQKFNDKSKFLFDLRQSIVSRYILILMQNVNK